MNHTSTLSTILAISSAFLFDLPPLRSGPEETAPIDHGVVGQLPPPITVAGASYEMAGEPNTIDMLNPNDVADETASKAATVACTQSNQRSDTKAPAVSHSINGGKHANLSGPETKT
ncbi:hypothetical protein POK33_37525 [Burkholderia cenocepacia]|uniref:hypothetical protein n=1 Tax=Burkholderia cenocepacia TaxID=95486 RepID=UPI0023B907AB|nr:hypothetical protein [Burkholderia cenocepacia]MDF0506457.1 hypothetical protein [Burkholderia cenocepacia]